jgi:phosphoglycolate phosphatase
VLALVGHGAPHLLSGLTGLAQDDAEFDGLLARFRDHYVAHQTERSCLYPEVEQTLDLLGARNDLYVLSNKPHPAVVHELEGQGLDRRFRRIWGAGALEVMKPDPAGVLEAMRLSGAAPAETVMIGDSGIDVATGLNASVATIFCSWGFNPLGPDDPRPSATADSLSDLPRLVAQLCRIPIGA